MGGHETKTLTVVDCGPWHAIYPSKADVLTDGTAKQIQAHDETGKRICGWVPPHAGTDQVKQ
jgi:hypothetical protein